MMLNGTPEDMVCSKELRTLSWGAVWRLPQQLRQVIVHLYMCNRSLEDTADVLDMTCDDVQLLHSRALDILKMRAQTWQSM